MRTCKLAQKTTRMLPLNTKILHMLLTSTTVLTSADDDGDAATRAAVDDMLNRLAAHRYTPQGHNEIPQQRVLEVGREGAQAAREREYTLRAGS